MDRAAPLETIRVDKAPRLIEYIHDILREDVRVGENYGGDVSTQLS